MLVQLSLTATFARLEHPRNAPFPTDRQLSGSTTSSTSVLFWRSVLS